MSESSVLLDVQHLKTYFPIKGGVVRKTVGYVHAVEDVSFQIHEQETFGLVGESGCGKSTTGRSILRLIEPTGGAITFDGVDLHNLDKESLRQKRRDMQLVFQDPYSSLNPRMTVRRLLEEPLRTHFSLSQEELDEQVLWISGAVGLAPEQLERYPHQFSGGQRQRISIARALITKPRFVVADEPVSALDVSIQAQILNLLMELQQELKLSYLFISHDLNAPPIPTPRPSSPPSPNGTRRRTRCASTWTATCPTPPILLRAALSTTAAPSAWRSARASCPSLGRSRRATSCPATCWTNEHEKPRSRWLRGFLSLFCYSAASSS